MAIMVIALILAVVMILRAFQGKPLKEVKGWLDMAIPILAIIGLGASIYLTYVEVTHTKALCGPVGDCNAVQSSPYAKLFGLIPIGLVGALGYIAILVTWLWRRFRTDAFSKVAGPIMFGMALFGTLFLRLPDLSRAVCHPCGLHLVPVLGGDHHRTDAAQPATSSHNGWRFPTMRNS